MQKRPASYSLHLDYIIRNSSSRKSKHKQEKHSRHKGIKSKINQVKVGYVVKFPVYLILVIMIF